MSTKPQPSQRYLTLLAVLLVSLMLASACGSRRIGVDEDGGPTPDTTNPPDLARPEPADAGPDAWKDDAWIYDARIDDAWTDTVSPYEPNKVCTTQTSVTPPCGRSQPAPPAGASAFERLTWGVAATWQGTADDQWSTPRTVKLVFDPDGYYGAQALVPGCGPAMYWGQDDLEVKRQYVLLDVMANGEGKGELDVHFFSGSQKGEMTRIAISDDGSKMTFEFYNTWKGRIGPVTFDLACQP